ncbi:MAG: hypothetical protein JWQ40_2186 [Segetibacter sp.]|nr:hypothetical protein [Segetibacter sp.]
MQFLNDDMDELFRRAGEEYPLNTNGADWDKVMQKLHHKEEVSPEDKNKKKDFKYLLLLLLLPLGFITGRYIGKDSKNNSTEINKKTAEHPGARITAPIADREKTGTGESPTKEPALNDEYSKVNSNTVSRHPDKGTVSVHNEKNNAAVSKSTKRSSYSETSINKFDGPLSDKTSGSFANDIESKIDKVAGKSDAAVESMAVPGSGNDPADFDTTLAKNDVSKSSSPQLKKDPAGINTWQHTNRKEPVFKRGLYYSFVFGPDVSTVKFQSLSNVGYSAGLLLGYRFSKKISVEGGVLFARRNYYTGGEYMDTSRLKLPMHSTVSKADGACNMFEFPLNLKYNFVSKRNHSWFLSAGASSYLMQKEDYDLTYTRYNQQYKKGYSYKNSSHDWLSVLNISAGYETLLGTHSHLQIAPYIKLPLRGVGIGKLPVTSTGVYVSISRPFR